MKARILLIEDSPAQGAAFRQKLLGLGFDVLWERTGILGIRAARRQHPDLVLLDLVLEDMDGFAVCRWLKLHAETRDVPVIMLTQRDGVDDRVAGLSVGAGDYINKSVPDPELEARILAALRSGQAQQELRTRNTELESMLHRVETLAMTDALTGLFNRRRFNEILHREHAVTLRYKNPLSVVLVDVDHFKRVNDDFGHAAGDEVLKMIARTLEESLRQVDVVARYGGEEFILLLPHTAAEGARIVAERIRQRVEALEPVLDGDKRVVTASFGIADTSRSGSEGPDALVNLADAALYVAKRGGRNAVVVSDFNSLLPAPDEDAPSSRRATTLPPGPHSRRSLRPGS